MHYVFDQYWGKEKKWVRKEVSKRILKQKDKPIRILDLEMRNLKSNRISPSNILKELMMQNSFRLLELIRILQNTLTAISAYGTNYNYHKL